MHKARCARLLVGVLGVLLLVSLSPVASSQPGSAHPDRLEWSMVDTPSGEGSVVVTPSEINTAVTSSNKTLYALDIPHSKIYKSTDSGITWEDDLNETLEDEGAKLPAWDMAVAPDDPDFVAVVTNNRTAVYYSKDGGEEWENGTEFDLGGTLISDIAVSPEYESGGDTYRDVAIGTRKPTDNAIHGNVWTILWRDLGNVWDNQNLPADITTVRFSPNYADDEMLFAIASWSNGTHLCAGQRYTDKDIHDATDWDTIIEIGDATGRSPQKNEIIFSDLALPPEGEYDKKDWIVYAGYYSNTTYDDVYRVENIDDPYAEGILKDNINVPPGEGVGIASLDYRDGLLIAGEVSGEENSANAEIHYCKDPAADEPDWEEPTKPPTGGAVSDRANALVHWTDTGMLYCATSTNNVTTAKAWANTTLPGPWSGNSGAQPDESAFSKSKDNGDTWNQFSLIDTYMDELSDYAFSADNSILYLASIGARYDSIWRTEETETELLTKTWQRVLCFKGAGNIILRPTPEWKRKEQIYFAVVNTRDVQYSEDKGQTWEQFRHCPDVTDLAVASDELLYILDNDSLNKCTWNAEKWGGIWEWQKDIDTELDSGSGVIAYGKDYVFISEKGGKSRIAYSSDGGGNFTLTESLPQRGEIQFAVDEEFDENKFIYAASDGSLSDVYRWTIGGTTEWDELNVPRGAAVGFCGMVQKGGVLYGAFQLKQGVARLLTPHLETIRTTDWDTLPCAEVNTAFKIGSLKAISTEDVEIWAIDDDDYFNGDVSRYDDPDHNTVGRLWTYLDAFSLQTPWANSPPPPATDSIPCDECTCRAVKFCFTWRMLPSTEKYDLWIALDEDFTAIVHKEENITPTDEYSPAWCPGDSLQFICGETYFWKVRSCESTEGDRIHSPWSPPLKFKVKECSAEGGETYLAPLLLVPEVGGENIVRSPVFSWEGFASTTEYEFILAKDAALADVIVTEKVPASHYQYQGQLDWDTTYYWQVKATEPVPSEPSVGVFKVMPPTEPSAPTPPTPSWVWVVIGILTFLDVLVIAFCLIKR